MLPPEKKWQLNQSNQKIVPGSAIPPLHPLVESMLASRGLNTQQSLEQFLYPERAKRIDPFLMDDMEAGVKRIREAVDRQEFIRIYGDYDADGVSSTVLMMKLFERLGANYDVYIPDRFTEGYGLNKAALDRAKQAGVHVIVTVDNGISAVEEARYAAELGMDIVITDHHEPPAVLPEAAAVINPRKPACSYPYKELAGVGVAYKLAEALLGDPPEEWLSYVALGTVADLMPLTGENRKFVKAGLQELRRTNSPGITALYQVGGVTANELTETDIGFALAPRINAAGRLQHAIHAVDCLAADEESAMSHAVLLETLNRERQEIVEKMTQEALAAMNGEHPVRQVIVLAKEGWHQGVVGIVASRLVDRFHVPVFLLSLDREAGKAKGSARSIPGYDIHKALTACDDLLEHYGGHAAAGGLTLDAQQIDELHVRLQKYADQHLQPENWKAELSVDITCKPEDVTLELIDSLQLLAPYGQANPLPVVMIAQGKIEDLRLLGKEGNHLKLWVHSSGDQGLECIGFRMGSLSHWLTSSSNIRVVGSLQVNEWNGRRKPQLLIKDLEIPDRQVFDHRQAMTPDQALDWLERWILRWKSEVRYEGLPGPLIWVRDWPKQQKAADLVAHVEALGGVIRKYGESNDPPSSHQDIIFFELPPDLPTFQQTLADSVSMQRCHILFRDSDEWDSTLPGREQFKLVYGWLKKMDQGLAIADYPVWAKRMGLSMNRLAFILDVFEELEFIHSSEEKVWAASQPAKKPLSDSHLYQQRKQASGLEEICLFSDRDSLSTWVKENAYGFEVIHSGGTGFS